MSASEDTIKKDKPSLSNLIDQSSCDTPPSSLSEIGNSEVLSAFLNRIRPRTRQNHPSPTSKEPLLTPMFNTTMEGPDDELNCPLCNTTTENQFQTILCDGCDHWYHTDCVDLSELDVKRLVGKDWYCSSCTKTPNCPFKAKAVTTSTTKKLPLAYFDPEPGRNGRSSKRKRRKARKYKLNASDACPECKDEVLSEDDNLLCSCCNKKNHRICLSLTNEKYLALLTSSDDWFCKDCIAKQYCAACENRYDISTKYKVPPLPSQDDKYCYCREGESGLMIECGKCKEWFHSTCLNLPESTLNQTLLYFCKECLSRDTRKSLKIITITLAHQGPGLFSWL